LRSHHYRMDFEITGHLFLSFRRPVGLFKLSRYASRAFIGKSIVSYRRRPVSSPFFGLRRNDDLDSGSRPE
ncbi:MAG: hypothetical protein COW41_00075, partial [Deltaproteobacteria bacterium CG17_big_fil_post_rev_8_21_14_2_50_51_6]